MKSRMNLQLRRRKAFGVSLIELMVALVIGLLLIAGALTVYMQSRNTYRTVDTVARLQEVGRYALDILEPDVRLAGYWGMKKGEDSITNTVADTSIGSNCGANFIGLAAQYIDARDSSYTTINCAATSQAAGTDALIVRRAESGISALDATKVQIQSNRLQATIFQGAAIPAGYSVAPGSETRDLAVNVYYISNPSAGTFALRRWTLRGSAMVHEEVIPGVQDLQVQFGIDSNGDNAVDQYVNPGAVGAARIIAARIWLMVTSETNEMGYTDSATYQYANVSHSAFNDARRRIVVSKTIQIRNALP